MPAATVSQEVDCIHKLLASGPEQLYHVLAGILVYNLVHCAQELVGASTSSEIKHSEVFGMEGSS